MKNNGKENKNMNYNKNKIKVNHDFNEVAEGVDYIMTIKDKNVLEADDDDLDVLENEILNQNKNLKLSEKRTLEKEQDQYLKDQILTKYDDEQSKLKGFVITNENKKAKIKNSDINLDLELDEKNNPIPNKNFSNNELKLIKEKLKGLRNSNSTHTNNSQEIIELNIEKKFTSDYMTPEEFKPKEFKSKKIINSNKKIKSLEINEEEVTDKVINNEKMKEVKNHKIFSQTEFYKSNEDEYDELSKFLEKQRNLVNKNKIIEAPEEKIKSLILNNKYEEEKKNQHYIGEEKDFSFIEKKIESKDLQQENLNIRKRKPDGKG